MTTQIAFIVWRESVEALLVIGILNAWIGQSGMGTAARRYLWGGVAAGLACALALAFAILRFSESLAGDRLEYFQTALVLGAAALIVQMVVWMRRHGRQMQRDLKHDLTRAAASGRWWMVFFLALIAVAREGSETVVFLYGLLGAGPGISRISVLAASATGLLLALASYALLQIGHRALSWRVFFRITEVMLLLFACALLVTGIGNLVALGFLPYTAPVWDTSWLLDDTGRVGGSIALLTGYRAAPDLATVATWGGFALLMAVVGWWQSHRAVAVREGRS